MLDVVEEIVLAIVFELGLLLVVRGLEAHELGLVEGLAVDGAASFLDVLGVAGACVAQGSVVLVVEPFAGTERHCGLEQFVHLGLGDGSWSRVGVGDGVELDDVVDVFLVLA